MSEQFVAGVGGILSADIAVPEHERELRFYSSVLTTGETPLWQAPSLLNNLGIPIIGLGGRTAAHDALPLQWMPHIQVADVDASVQRALALGGAELMSGKDAGGKRQWAVLRDPNGAAFGLVPVVPAEAIAQGDGAPAGDAAGPVGRIAWVDLTVADAEATRDFYCEVVGWTAQELEIVHGEERYADYMMLAGDGNAVAGVCHARGPNVSLPPVWLIYLPVGDLAASLSRVQEGGGEILKASRNKDGTYTYAVVRDPMGVALALAPAQ